MKMGITAACSTRFNASSSGQSLEAICNEKAAQQARHMGAKEASKPFITSPSWRDLGTELISSLSHDIGLSDGNALCQHIHYMYLQATIEGRSAFLLSNTLYRRALTQLSLKRNKLNSALPSMAEALLSMATCTVLDLTPDFPFASFWASATFSAFIIGS
jgi:hypothetical protein